MKRILFFTAVVASFVIGYFAGCGDEPLPAAETGRTVYEVSEANVTGNGGVVDAPVVKVGQEGQGGASQSLVEVYASGYSGTNHWRPLVNVEVYAGKVKIDPDEYPSYYYRVVVIN